MCRGTRLLGEKSIDMRAFGKKLKNIYLLSFCIPVLGMLGIFVVIGVIAGLTMLLNAVTAERKNNDEND